MKVKVHGGGAAGYGPNGTIDAWAVDEIVEVDDGNDQAVAWARQAVDTGFADLVEDVRKASTSRKES